MHLGLDVNHPRPVVMLDVGFPFRHVGRVRNDRHTSPLGYFSMEFGAGLVKYLDNPHAVTLMG